jgi:hypothetical protein
VNCNERDFGWEIAHAAVSRRPPISLYTIVARTEGYTCTAEVWDLSIVQGAFSVAPCQTLALRIATFASLHAGASERTGDGQHRGRPARARRAVGAHANRLRALCARRHRDPPGHGPGANGAQGVRVAPPGAARDAAGRSLTVSLPPSLPTVSPTVSPPLCLPPACHQPVSPSLCLRTVRRRWHSRPSARYSRARTCRRSWSRRR